MAFRKLRGNTPYYRHNVFPMMIENRMFCGFQ